MRKSTVFVCFAVIAIIVLMLWHKHYLTNNEDRLAATNASSTLSAFGGKTNLPMSPNKSAEATDNSKTTIPADVLEFVRQTRLDPTYEWKQPVSFFGQVLDISNTPIGAADIHFKLNDLSETGTSEFDVKSDENGFFSLTNKRGKYLYVSVGKNGYYDSHQSGGYEYANPADGLFKPDSNRPVLFYLRKKGVGVELITSKYGMTTDFPVHIPRDGTPLKVDFMQRQAGDNGQMTITENKPDFKSWKQATNWWFRMEIADGGFVAESDEFPFAAPDDGYTNVVEFNFQKGQPDWILNLQKDYYIKFGNPPKFGLLHVKTSVSYDGAFLNYAINPSGSQNLEPK